jgi:hypothetical protein
MGLASCIVAGVTLVMVLIQAMVLLMARLDGAGGQPTTGDWMLGFAMLGSLCGGGLCGIVGILLGIIGLIVPNRPRRLALIGLVGNVVLLLVLWAMVAMSP